MGVVWLATNVLLGSQVAVKVLQGADHEETRLRFIQEARGLAQIDSPHVVRIFDFGLTEDAEPFIVMELLKGENLRDRILREKSLDVPTTSLVLRQLCSALTAAHE